jgi:uncharacterized protein YkwD
MRFLLLPALFLLSFTARADISAIYGKYSPTGSVSNTQPTVSWKLTPTGGGHVSRVEMVINERLVKAEFNPSSSAVEYKPDQPLLAGLYSVVCRVTIERQVILRQDWTFEISAGRTGRAPRNNGETSLEPKPGASYAAGYALETTNEIRAELGLPNYAIDERMNLAASAHSRYQALNGMTCHIEDPNKPGYTGKAPWDRIQHFGYDGVCYEGACGGQSDPRKAIRLLFDAPYHRIAFLQPGSPQVGIGFEGGSMTIDYAVSNQEGSGVSPGPGQTGIPLSWDGNESPSPLRVFGASGPVGYPIVFGWFSPRLENITVSSMRLFGPSGAEVATYVNTPNNDAELRFAGVMTPKQRLRPNTTYTAEVRAYTERGTKIDRTWAFTTGS